MELNRCFGCMQEKQNHPVCEHCGFDERKQNEAHQLPLGTILRGQYLIGRVLGQGGFGITYLGWDMYLDMPVAIKEYYPGGLVSRDVSISIRVDNYSSGETEYISSKERFLREGQVLAQFSDLGHIVKTHGLFAENNTVYLVMEYAKGRTLQNTLKQEGLMDLAAVMELLGPIMEDLQKVHARGIIHRDISPDNIMVLEDGGAKLLDFGAVRQVVNPDQEGQLSQSTQAILKQGFAPAEQYTARGNLGPWTDVYALCATICYCLNGKLPPAAPDRSISDDPDGFMKALPLTQVQKAVFCRGMALRPRDRIPSVEALRRALLRSLDPHAELQSVLPEQPEQKNEKKQEPKKVPKKKRKWLWLLPAGLAAAAAAAVLLLNPFSAEAPEAPQAALPALQEETVPSLEETEAIYTEPAYTEEPGPQIPFDWTLLLRNSDPEGTSEYAFGTDILKKDVTSVEFFYTLEGAPENAVDVSQSGSGRVLLWEEPDPEAYGISKLNIAGDGKVFLPEDSRFLFGGQSVQSKGFQFTALRRIRFSGAVDTSRVKNMGHMFSGCAELEKLWLGAFDTGAVTDMSGLFSDCESLENLDITFLNTEKVTDMTDMFSGCKSVPSLNLEFLNTEKVTDMSGMFRGCSSLKALAPGSLETGAVTDMSEMFSGCAGLRELDLSGLDTGRVTTMEKLFHNCVNLRQLNLSGLNTEKVTSMSWMFGGCVSLESLDVSGLNTGSTENFWAMFYQCSKLKSLDLSNFQTEKAASMGNMFFDCGSLESLDVSSFRTASVTNMWGMFSGCKNLRQLDVSGFDTENVTEMACMFRDCSSLQNLDVSGFRTEKVTSMGKMFAGCSGLASLDLQKFDTSGVVAMADIFSGCSQDLELLTAENQQRLRAELLE